MRDKLCECVVLCSSHTLPHFSDSGIPSKQYHLPRVLGKQTHLFSLVSNLPTDSDCAGQNLFGKPCFKDLGSLTIQENHGMLTC